MADLIYFSKSLIGLKIPEYNPAVSLSYIWGNNSYSLKRVGDLSHGYNPEPKEYEQGEKDHAASILELSQDLAEMLDEVEDPHKAFGP